MGGLMKKYSVLLRETLVHTIIVEAENVDDAYKTANELIETADPDTYETESEGIFETEVPGEVSE